jgi:hypothetical protein
MKGGRPPVKKIMNHRKMCELCNFLQKLYNDLNYTRLYF